jgi:hypothetical protein
VLCAAFASDMAPEKMATTSVASRSESVFPLWRVENAPRKHSAIASLPDIKHATQCQLEIPICQGEFEGPTIPLVHAMEAALGRQRAGRQFFLPRWAWACYNESNSLAKRTGFQRSLSGTSFASHLLALCLSRFG